MTLFGEDWTIAAESTDPAKERALADELSLGRLTARVLASRGYDTAEKARRFLGKDGLVLYDPFLMKDMDKACERIRRAIDEHQSVCIYGDYDVDGVTSTTVLCLYLRSKGVRCSCYIPERLSEGFGLNMTSIKSIAEYANLIITVDTGITATEEAKYASSLGVDIVITDHHSCRDIIPEACAVVNPRREDCDYPFKSLAGVGVVFKLICALEGDSEKILEEYADLVAIGTVADVMPIADENRLIVSRGLEKLARTKRTGLMALLDNSGVPDTDGSGVRKVTTSTVGYVIAPRLNAAGRIASAGKSLDLLLSDDYAAADMLAKELCEINKQRQCTEQTILDEAIKQISTSSLGVHTQKYSYILSSDSWHQGIVGVVASKIAEKYSLPVILFSFDGDIGKGSGRSVKGLNLTGILEKCSDLLLEYGGHELAAGLSIEREKLPAFTERFEKLSREELEGKEIVPVFDIDCELHFDEITLKNADELLVLEPFGLSNPVPSFIIRGATIGDVIPMSSDKHIRLKITDGRGSNEMNAVCFGISHREFPLCRGDVCDIACTLGINEYHGVRYPQVYIRAIRPPEQEMQSLSVSRELYQKAVNPADETPLPSGIIPDINDFRTAYRVLKREIGNERKRISMRYLKRRIEITENEKIDLCALKLITDVMDEFGLSETARNRNDIVEIQLEPAGRKVDLDKSVLLRRLKNRVAHDTAARE